MGDKLLCVYSKKKKITFLIRPVVLHCFRSPVTKGTAHSSEFSADETLFSAFSVAYRRGRGR